MSLDYSRDQIRDKFIDTLPPACRSTVLMTVSPDTTLPDLVDKAQCYFDLNNGNLIKQQPHEQAFLTQQSTVDGKLQSLCSRLGLLETNVKVCNDDVRPILNRVRSTYRRSVREPRNRSITQLPHRQDLSFRPHNRSITSC
ncbi:hypothetical protein HOLleu_40381 [Holothuria leucospilota]|uniref:Uncharacterized protein n=1 Tax=Holothuria leucospilota TaxID=206669 RepID=A0A9Q1BCT8_HOLLE|nr:hypothetical protein HOLleu_40381 [Holothuria leucospilota]